MREHGEIVTAAHVKIAGLRDDQRMRLFRCARAIRDARNDRQKRKRALADLDQALQFYEAIHVLSEADVENIRYTLGRGI